MTSYWFEESDEGQEELEEPDGSTDERPLGEDKRTAQNLLFDIDEHLAWKEHWVGMPEYVSNDITPYKTLMVHFKSPEDYRTFENLVEQTLTDRTKFIWYPKVDHAVMVGVYRYSDES